MPMTRAGYFAGASFFLLMVVCLFFPKQLQKEYSDYIDKRKIMTPLLGYANSKLFIFNVRLCGVVSFLMFIVVILAAIYGVVVPSVK
jgi:Mg/Co/Ni transporter MgtE